MNDPLAALTEDTPPAAEIHHIRPGGPLLPHCKASLLMKGHTASPGAPPPRGRRQSRKAVQSAGSAGCGRRGVPRAKNCRKHYPEGLRSALRNRMARGHSGGRGERL